MQTVPYSVLQAEKCRITSGSSLSTSAAFQVDQTTTAAGQEQVTLLLCAQQQLAASSEAAGAVVVAADHRALCCKQVPGAPAAAKAVRGSCSSRRLTLEGSDAAPTAISKWQAIATRVHTAQASPHWQLQPTFTVPSLRQAWPSQHQPWGAFTAAAVLLDTAQLSTPQYTQQLQALVPAGAAGTDPVQLLSAAAAGLLAAGETPEGTSQHSSSTCAAVSDPIHCSSTLYAALSNPLQLQQQQQQAGQQFSRGASSVTTTAQPAALVLAATSSGQVWVCDPVAMLQDSQKPVGMPQLQPGSPLKLLFDLQQRVVAVLPVNLAAGTDALLLLGSLGRVVLLQQKQQQQQSASLTAGQQLQLPFQVATASVVAAGGGSSAARQTQAGDAQPLLLLLSPSGRLYAASLHSVGAAPAAAAAAAAAAGAGVQAGSATAAVTPGTLQLQPVQVQLPAAACRLWTVKQQPCSSTTVALNRSSASAVGCIHSSIVLQLTGSCQLLEVSVQDLQAAVAAAAGPSGSAQLSTAVSGSSTPAAGAAAAAAAAAVRSARQQLEQLLAALETLAAAQQVLRQAAGQQEAYLQGMQQDTKLLGLLQQQQQQVRHLSGAQQQQQQRSLAAATGLANSQGQAALRCSIHLHGLWPVLGSASARDPSSSIHLALSLKLQQAIKTAGSSSSAGFRGRLGPGWQLVVSFVPESADSSSVQTTVSMNNDLGGGCSSSSSADGGGLQASLMLRLPASCAALQEGGWVVLYAVKHSPLSAHSLAGRTPTTANSSTSTAAAAGCAWQGRQQRQRQGQSSAQLQQGLPPVVTLLGHQYVGVMQLSAMAGANPAVQAAVKSAGTLRSHPPIRSPAVSSTGSSAAATYSCLLQLAAAAGAGAGAGAPSDAAAGAHGGVKRARHGPTAAAAVVGSAGQAPQQQAGSAGAQADRTRGSSAGAFALQDWLYRALCLYPGPSEPPPLLVSSAHWDPFGGLPTVLSSSSSSSGASGHSRGGLQTEIGPAGLPPQVARQGQAVFVLGGGELGRANWGLSTAGQEVPSRTLLDAAAGGVQGSGAEGAGAASVSVQLHAGRVPTLASMHRAVLLDLLQQLEGAGGSESGGRVQSWRMVSSVPQLKLAAARLRQLHQQLLKLQDSAGEAQDLLARQATIDTVGQLEALLVGLEQGLCAGYGRFLLAVGDTLQVALFV